MYAGKRFSDYHQPMISNPYRLALFLSAFLILFNTKSSSNAPVFNLDSLKEIVEAGDSPDSLLFEAYYNLAWGLKSSTPAKAMEYAREALAIAERNNNRKRIAEALTNIGVIYWQMGNFNMALDFHLEANSIYHEVKDDIGIARALTNIGIIFSDQSHYEKALEYFFKGLTLYEKHDHKQGMAAVLNNIGMVYEYQGDLTMAESFHLQSLEIKKSINDIKGISFSYNNLGLVYQGMQKMDLAREFFNKALEIREQLQDKRELANTISNLGYLNYLLGEVSVSRNYLDKALNLYTEVDDKSGIAKTLNYLGHLYFQAGELEIARQYFSKSLEISRSIGLNRMLTENYASMARLMATMGDFRQAYTFQTEFIAMKDSIYSEESRRKIIELQMMYDREKRESDLELMHTRQQMNQLSSQHDKLFRNFLIIGVVLILVTLFLLYNRFLIARNANVLLESQKAEISATNAQLMELNQSLMEQKRMYEELNLKLNQSNHKLKESEKNLMEINATKDKFFSIISHDLRNPFASIVSFSRILKRDILNMSKEDLSELALELDKSVLKIDNLLENLLQWSRTQTGKIKYRPEYLALHEIVKDNLNLFKNNARDKNISLVDDVADDLAIWADRNMTDTVIRNLLSNALKYTETGGEIIISGRLANHKVEVSVSDNGVGMSEESQRKIFRTDTLHSTYGTMDEKGSGLGLLLCKEFVEKQGGSISFTSKLGQGSEFTFTLPVEEF